MRLAREEGQSRDLAHTGKAETSELQHPLDAKSGALRDVEPGASMPTMSRIEESHPESLLTQLQTFCGPADAAEHYRGPVQPASQLPLQLQD